jgi:hypothetical protein
MSSENSIDFQRTTRRCVPKEKNLREVLRYHLQNQVLEGTLLCLQDRSVGHGNSYKCKAGRITTASTGNTRCHIPEDSTLHKDRCDNQKTKLRGLSPRANYTDRETAAC